MSEWAVFPADGRSHWLKDEILRGSVWFNTNRSLMCAQFKDGWRVFNGHTIISEMPYSTPQAAIAAWRLLHEQ